MKVSMWENAIDASAHRSKLLHARLLDVHSEDNNFLAHNSLQLRWDRYKKVNLPTRKVTVAVKQASSSVQRVPCVVNGTTLCTKVTKMHVVANIYLFVDDWNMTALYSIILSKIAKRTSLGFLWAAHRNIHCSVAVIWVHTCGLHSSCKRTVILLSSRQNCRKCSYFQTPSSCCSGAASMVSTSLWSLRISCWMNCCTASVLSISSRLSSDHLFQSLCVRWISLWNYSIELRFTKINT